MPFPFLVALSLVQGVRKYLDFFTQEVQGVCRENGIGRTTNREV